MYYVSKVKQYIGCNKSYCLLITTLVLKFIHILLIHNSWSHYISCLYIESNIHINLIKWIFNRNNVTITLAYTNIFLFYIFINIHKYFYPVFAYSEFFNYFKTFYTFFHVFMNSLLLFKLFILNWIKVFIAIC